MKQQGRNTASYFKKIHNFSQKSATENAKKINRNSIVFHKFEAILSNLEACPLVDIKRLSENQLYLATDSKWCHMYNEMQRGRSNKPAHLDYDQADFDDLLRLVKDHPVYQSIDKSKENNYRQREITSVTLRLQRELLSHR